MERPERPSDAEPGQGEGAGRAALDQGLEDSFVGAHDAPAWPLAGEIARDHSEPTHIRPTTATLAQPSESGLSASATPPIPPVLVTGAAGFLGAWTIAHLLRRGAAVTAFDIEPDRRRLTQLVGEPSAATVPWITGDITAGTVLHSAMERSGARALLHLAALQIPACRANPVLGAEVNVIGQLRAFEAARALGLEKVVYTSSIAALPRGALAAPGNLYGVFKRAAEDIAKVYCQDHGVPSLGLRPYVVYGVGRDAGETAPITTAIRAAAFGEDYAMPFAGSGAFQYAAEVADIIVRCLGAPIAGAAVADLSTTTVTVDDVIAAIRRQVPGARIVPSAEPRPAPAVAFDDGPLRRLIGDWGRVSLDEGIAATIRAFRRVAAGHPALG
ncbi:MAG: SDR family oxidoreductase [Alphaproteobacteria bacterium]|nr:SDR family oxidoreductase [Alphaproteobacteria bacterium]